MMARHVKNIKGFTLAELIVVMGIFMVILMISASAFESVLKVSAGLHKSAQGQMEGVVGLEILRKDLNAAGYGLPWSFLEPPNPATYLEADFGANNPVRGLSGNDFNDARAMAGDATPATPSPPRAVVLGTVPEAQSTIYQTRTLTGSAKMDANPGSDYLVIKSGAVAFNTAVGKWGYVNYSGTSTTNSSYITKFNSAEDLAANEVVVTHINTFSGVNQSQHVLAMQDASNFAYTLDGKNAAGSFLPPDANYMPTGNIVDPFGAKINNEKMVVYALRNATSPTDTSLPVRMPFNRADYYVRRPLTPKDTPAHCNPGTGILYKTVITNSLPSPGRTEYPLLDCVGDMQVIFDMQDPVDSNKTIIADTLAGLTAEEIRNRLKTIRVYLLVQEGSIDKSYQYPFTDASRVITVADDRSASMGRTFTATDMANFFGPDWRNYRWKVYTVVGQPYNLLY